jgi:hypothetical protein
MLPPRRLVAAAAEAAAAELSALSRILKPWNADAALCARSRMRPDSPWHDDGCRDPSPCSQLPSISAISFAKSLYAWVGARAVDEGEGGGREGGKRIDFVEPEAAENAQKAYKIKQRPAVSAPIHDSGALPASASLSKLLTVYSLAPRMGGLATKVSKHTFCIPVVSSFPCHHLSTLSIFGVCPYLLSSLHGGPSRCLAVRVAAIRHTDAEVMPHLIRVMIHPQKTTGAGRHSSGCVSFRHKTLHRRRA